MVCQKTGKKTKNISFSINNHPIEIVQEYTYLGVKITTSGNFNLYQKTLAEKGLNTFYKVYKKLISSVFLYERQIKFLMLLLCQYLLMELKFREFS